MGRHYRDEEPVPHPQDRTPREGRSESSGAFRTPGRSSISDAFGIAGRASRESSGSAFFTEGAEAPGFPPPEPSGPPQASRRGETSGAQPVADRGQASGAYPAVGQPPVTRAPHRGEGAPRGSRRGEASGAYPVATEAPRTTRAGEASGAYPAATGTTRRGEASGSYPAATGRRGDTTGAYATASADTRPGRRGENTGAAEVPTGAYAAASTDTRSGRRGEASGAYPAATETPGTGRRSEHTGATRSGRRGRETSPAESGAEVTTAYPAVGTEAPERPGRRGKRAARQPEAAAERTEVITRQEDAPGDTVALRTPERTDSTGPQRAGRTDSTGPQRAGRSEGTGSHRVLGKGEATGSHRIVGKKAPRRRIATWPIACLVLAVLIGLGVVGWNWADNELNSRAEAQAASCDGGTAQMRIVVTPSAQKPLTAAAQRWNQAATVVHGQCVHINIDAKPSAQVLDALVGRSNLDAIGGLPAAWLPESSYWVSELTTKKPEMIGSPAQSVANARSADYPFVGLAGPGIDDTALRAAQTFREYLEQPAQQADFAAAGIKSA
jgi:hypothetical protein